MKQAFAALLLGVTALQPVAQASGPAQPSAPPASAASGAPAASSPGNQPEPLVLLVPVEVQNPAMQSGCWAQLYDERNFKGDMLTIVGPMELQTLDKSTGRHLRRSIDSVVLGPKAKLTLFEHRMFRDRSVTFAPNARESGVLGKVGITGRIESLKLECNQ